MSSSDIQNIFLRLAASQAEVRLFNVYQGIPISFPATVLASSGPAIRVKTEKYQILCLYRERETYLQSSLISGVLKARVTAVDLSKLEASLSTFQPITSHIGSRRQVRVQPKEYITGDIKNKDLIQTFRGELADLSQDGLSIYLPRKHFYPRVYPEGGAITIAFRLPGEYEIGQLPASDLSAPRLDPISRFERSELRHFHLRRPHGSDEQTGPGDKQRSPLLEIHGLIANIREESALRKVRIGVHIHPGDPSRPVIARFISSRQAEILRELKELCDLIS